SLLISDKKNINKNNKKKNLFIYNLSCKRMPVLFIMSLCRRCVCVCVCVCVRVYLWRGRGVKGKRHSCVRTSSTAVCLCVWGVTTISDSCTHTLTHTTHTQS